MSGTIEWLGQKLNELVSAGLLSVADKDKKLNYVREKIASLPEKAENSVVAEAVEGFYYQLLDNILLKIKAKPKLAPAFKDWANHKSQLLEFCFKFLAQANKSSALVEQLTHKVEDFSKKDSVKFFIPPFSQTLTLVLQKFQGLINAIPSITLSSVDYKKYDPKVNAARAQRLIEIYASLDAENFDRKTSGQMTAQSSYAMPSYWGFDVLCSTSSLSIDSQLATSFHHQEFTSQQIHDRLTLLKYVDGLMQYLKDLQQKKQLPKALSKKLTSIRQRLITYALAFDRPKFDSLIAEIAIEVRTQKESIQSPVSILLNAFTLFTNKTQDATSTAEKLFSALTTSTIESPSFSKEQNEYHRVTQHLVLKLALKKPKNFWSQIFGFSLAPRFTFDQLIKLIEKAPLDIAQQALIDYKDFFIQQLDGAEGKQNVMKLQALYKRLTEDENESIDKSMLIAQLLLEKPRVNWLASLFGLRSLPRLGADNDEKFTELLILIQQIPSQGIAQVLVDYKKFLVRYLDDINKFDSLINVMDLSQNEAAADALLQLNAPILKRSVGIKTLLTIINSASIDMADQYIKKNSGFLSKNKDAVLNLMKPSGQYKRDIVAQITNALLAKLSIKQFKAEDLKLLIERSSNEDDAMSNLFKKNKKFFLTSDTGKEIVSFCLRCYNLTSDISRISLSKKPTHFLANRATIAEAFLISGLYTISLNGDSREKTIHIISAIDSVPQSVPYRGDIALLSPEKQRIIQHHQKFFLENKDKLLDVVTGANNSDALKQGAADLILFSTTEPLTLVQMDKEKCQKLLAELSKLIVTASLNAGIYAFRTHIEVLKTQPEFFIQLLTNPSLDESKRTELFYWMERHEVIAPLDEYITAQLANNCNISSDALNGYLNFYIVSLENLQKSINGLIEGKSKEKDALLDESSYDKLSDKVNKLVTMLTLVGGRFEFISTQSVSETQIDRINNLMKQIIADLSISKESEGPISVARKTLLLEKIKGVSSAQTSVGQHGESEKRRVSLNCLPDEVLQQILKQVNDGTLNFSRLGVDSSAIKRQELSKGASNSNDNLANSSAESHKSDQAPLTVAFEPF